MIALSLAAAFVPAVLSPPALPQSLDETWTVTVNGQSVQANPDGTFVVPNVSAVDLFGAAGPGTAPDFVSDDYLRVTAVSTVDGVTRYAFSEPFLIEQGKTLLVGPLIFTDTPPPLPVSISMSLVDEVVPEGQQTGATVLATLPDGSEADVTAATAWTTYKTSNATVATVDANGIVSANAPGIAFLTAVNDGAASVAQILVSDESDPLTTIVGFVELEDGTPVEGAEISLVNLPIDGTSGVGGAYELEGVPTLGVPEYVVRAIAEIEGEIFLGTSAAVVPVPGGDTDAGVIVLGETGGFGPVILSGMDPEDHGAGVGGAGWEMIRDIMRFVTDESLISANEPKRVLQLGGSSFNSSIAQSAASSLGYDFTHAPGSQILSEDFFAYDSLYMPTTQGQVNGGLNQQELDFINQRELDVQAFINAGGGLAAFSQELAGAYAWFPLDGLEAAPPSTSSGITITPEGAFILSPSATAVQPFHTAFLGPAGYFGLDVLALESGGDMQPLIIGGIVILPPE